MKKSDISSEDEAAFQVCCNHSRLIAALSEKYAPLLTKYRSTKTNASEKNEANATIPVTESGEPKTKD